MQSIRSISLALALIGAVMTTGSAFAHEGHEADAKKAKNSGQLVAVTEKDAAWVTKAKAEYPTSVCVVSEDKLGDDMGKPVDYIYRQDGKPDRLVTFCCKDCVKDFNEDPAKYLKVLDSAAAKKTGDVHAEPAPKH